MPSMTNAPDDLDSVLDDLWRGLELIDEKADEYVKARDYYDGTRAEVSANKVIAKILDASAQAHPVSLAHIPVDALFDKVELASITAKDGTAATKLAEWFDDNDIEDEADDWQRKAGYFGDYYVIVDPLDVGEGGVATAANSVGSSPLSTVMVYSAADQRTALFGVKRWSKGKRWYAVVYYDDCTVLFESKVDGTSVPKRDGWAPLTDDDGNEGSERIAHAGGRNLLKHIAIDGKPYGTPVHRKAWGPQDAITKISATNLSSVDGLGFPARWALLDPTALEGDDIDDDFGTDGPDTAGNDRDGVTTVTKSASKPRSIPGEIQLLRGIREVGQFDAANTDNFLKNLDWYVRVMAVATGVPLFEFDLNGEQPSGEARRRAESRINKHARKVQRALSRAFVDLGDTVLAVMGIESEVTATFRPTETETDKDGLELVSAKINAGVPVAQALKEAGYTDEQVDDWFKKGDPHITPDLLVALATALAQLGTAKTLGIITDTELADMLPTILTAARGEGVARGVPALADAAE